MAKPRSNSDSVSSRIPRDARGDLIDLRTTDSSSEEPETAPQSPVCGQGARRKAKLVQDPLPVISVPPIPKPPRRRKDSPTQQHNELPDASNPPVVPPRPPRRARPPRPPLTSTRSHTADELNGDFRDRMNTYLQAALIESRQSVELRQQAPYNLRANDLAKRRNSTSYSSDRQNHFPNELPPENAPGNVKPLLEEIASLKGELQSTTEALLKALETQEHLNYQLCRKEEDNSKLRQELATIEKHNKSLQPQSMQEPIIIEEFCRTLECMICLETPCLPLFVCPSCVRMLGCLQCARALAHCPNCRAALPLHKQPLRGLESLRLILIDSGDG